MSTAAGYANFFDSRTAAITRLAFAAKDVGKLKIAALLAFGVNIVSIGRTTLLNR